MQAESSTMKKMLLLTLLAMSLSLSLFGCGPKDQVKSQLDGVYSSAMGNFTFNPNGTVSAVMAGNLVETPYHIDGDRITFRFPGGNDVILTKMADGNLNGGILGKFTKKQ